MPKFCPPEPLPFDQPSKWPEWRERFERFRIASKLHKDEGEVQVSTLIYCMGRQAENIFKTFQFDLLVATDDNGDEIEVDPKNDYNEVITRFDAYFVPKKNKVHERTKFHQRSQHPGESIEAFVRSLHDLAQHCGFKEMETECIRDRLISGMRDAEESRKLQMEQDELTLERTVEIARHWEMVKSQNSVTTSAIQNMRRKKSKSQSLKAGKPQSQPSATAPPPANSDKCGRCGYVHRSKRENGCPALGKTCAKCKKKNHFASVCRNKQALEVTATRHDEYAAPVEQDYYCGSIVNIDDSSPAWYVNLEIVKNSTVKFKVDSGADVTILSLTAYQKLQPKPSLGPSKSVINSPGGGLSIVGEFITNTKYEDKDYCFKIIVVNQKTENLLSRGVSEKMGLIKRVDVASFSVLKTEPVHIELKEGAEPSSVNVARRVAIPLLPAVQAELEKMKNEDIIREIKKPTKYCSAMVVVQKPPQAGKEKDIRVRICVDLKHVNKNVKRERYILPTLEDVTSKLSGAQVFSTLDAASGFYQVPLDEESQELTTFITPVGRYCFKRLPFGITSAPEIFMRKMNEVLEGLDGVSVYMDDILVYGENMDAHDKNLKAVISRLNDVGLMLNPDKCVYRQSELKFLGHIFSKDGVKADPEKVKAIQNMPSPSNVDQLRQILGMIHYLGTYIPDLATISQPLNALLKSDVVWSWGPEQEQALCHIRDLLSTTPVLSYYDITKKVVVSADASSYGLGGVLLQEQPGGKLQPVAYCSRTLTPTEQRYAQIEKECLASVYACEKFERFLLGLSEFKLLTDHKPLVPLINTCELFAAPLRCQRLLMRLMRFNANAEYAPGKTLVVSDALSRSPLPETTADMEEEIEYYVQSVTQSLPMSPKRIKEIQIASQEDSDIKMAMLYTLSGWPKFESDVPQSVHEMFHIRSQLSVTEGLLTVGDRIFIPPSLRPNILDCLHEGHLGTTKCLERARVAVYWPGMSGDIKAITSTCEFCQEHRPSQVKEPLLPSSLPAGPWQRVGADLAFHAPTRRNYLVVVDYFSRWIECVYLSATTSTSVIVKLKDIFSRHGIPYELVSDNGPQFSSLEFRQFAENYDFVHVTSSPHNPRANGAAERAVKTCKEMLDQDDPWLAMLNYRDTVIQATGKSPAELMLGRHLRSKLPTLPSTLTNKNINMDIVREKDEKYREKYTSYHDKHNGVKSLPDLHPGDIVKVKTDEEKRWLETGKVIEKANTPRSYQVKTPNGNIIRRNRRHLMKTPTRPPSTHGHSPVILESQLRSDSQPMICSSDPPPLPAHDSTPKSKVKTQVALPPRSPSKRIIRRPVRLIEEP